MIPTVVVSKSIFDIRPFNKKSVTVGLLMNNQISIIVLLECNLTKKVIMLDLEQWNTLICESNYILITNNLHVKCKRMKITDNIFYSNSIVQSTIRLYVNDNFITLSFTDLFRLKQLQQCVNTCIIEKQKKLVSYQKTFDEAYSLIKADITELPPYCQQNNFTDQYIQNYDFSHSSIQNDDSCFIHEILQYHYNSLSYMILQDLIGK